MLEKKSIDYEKAVLIGVINRSQNEEKVTEYLDELQFLTYTAGGEVTKRFVQRMDVPNPKTLIGSGKMEEVEAYVKANDIGSVIFDDELSPAQQRNIEKLLRCKILIVLVLFWTSLHSVRKRVMLVLR
jgi:GTP-binding protein HflX